MVNQAFELKHGRSTKLFNMDKVSNGPFLEVGFLILRLRFSHAHALIDAERIREVAESMFGRRGQDAYKTGYGEEGG